MKIREDLDFISKYTGDYFVWHENFYWKAIAIVFEMDIKIIAIDKYSKDINTKIKLKYMLAEHIDEYVEYYDLELEDENIISIDSFDEWYKLLEHQLRWLKRWNYM